MTPALRQSSPYDARQVANFLLNISDARKIRVTNMSINKLVFLAHGNYLAARGRPLVHNPFEAWDHGPVSPALYAEFRCFGAAPITARATILDLLTNERFAAPAFLEAEHSEFVSKIFAIYGHLDAFTLSDITHEADCGAWQQALLAFERSANFGKRISDEDIHKSFSRALSH